MQVALCCISETQRHSRLIKAAVLFSLEVSSDLHTFEQPHPNMSGAIHPTFAVCLALCLAGWAVCLAGWAVSGASVEAQKTSPVCYLCNDKKCQTVESVYDHFKDNFTLWSRGKMAEIPPCNTMSPLPSGECLVCVDNQKIYAVCDSEIIKPVFEGQDNSMPAIEANCTSIFSTDGTDPNAPTLTPDGTGGLSKEENITIGVLAPMAFLIILFIIVALCRRTRSMSTSEVHSEQHQTQLKLLETKVEIV